MAALRGRPPVAHDKRRDRDVRVPVTAAEGAALDAWAAAAAKPLATLARETLLRAAKRAERSEGKR